MQPLNTSHNNQSYNGILQPFIDVLFRNPRQKGRLIGQEVTTPRTNVKAIIAVDGENNIHLLLSPAPNDDSQFNRLELRSLKISIQNWSVAGYPPQTYLDIACSTGITPSFQRPFLRFAEDVLFEISQINIVPADAVYRTGTRWRKFWSQDSSTAITQEWLYGIYGELAFLEEMLKRFGETVIHSWVGPSGQDHDFQHGNYIAVEVKTSVEKPFRVHCNIRQLDPTLFKILYIACYKVVVSESGESIPELVRKIENSIGDDLLKDVFYDKLVQAGYRRDLETIYNETRLEKDAAAFFLVDEIFPKITESSFIKPPDHRISGVRYMLQLTGIRELTFDETAEDLKKLTTQ